MNSTIVKTWGIAIAILQRGAFIPPLLARISLGIVFAQSGWEKLNNLERTVGYFQSLGIPFASLQAPMVAGIEFVGGCFLVIGLFTRLWSLALAGVIGVALVTALVPELESPMEVFGLSETSYLVIFLWLLVSGPGKASLDHYASCYLQRRSRRWSMPRPRKLDQEKILWSAMHLFWKKGYVSTSLEDLEREIGIKRGSLYADFANKEALFLECIRWYKEKIVHERRELVESAASARQGIEAYFKALTAPITRRSVF